MLTSMINHPSAAVRNWARLTGAKMNFVDFINFQNDFDYELAPAVWSEVSAMMEQTYDITTREQTFGVIK